MEHKKSIITNPSKSGYMFGPKGCPSYRSPYVTITTRTGRRNPVLVSGKAHSNTFTERILSYSFSLTFVIT